jgi:hypothetical protein
MVWRRPGILVLSDRRQGTMNAAEQIIKGNGCVVQMSLNYERQESFVLRKGRTEVSPSFRTLTQLCEWVVKNHDELFRRVEQCQ